MRIFNEPAPDGAARAQIDAALDRIRDNLSGVTAIVAVASAKGGVGKSVVAVNVAVALALKARKVALVDGDFNSPSVVQMLGMKTPRNLPMTEGIEPVPGPHGLRIVASDLIPGGAPPPVTFLGDESGVEVRGPERPSEIGYSDALRTIFGQARLGTLDYVIADLAPGLGDIDRIARTIPLAGLLLVSNTSRQSAIATRDAIKLAQAHTLPVIGIVENMAGFNCDGCRSVRPLWPEGELASVARETGPSIIARLPFDSRIAEATDRGVPFVDEYADTPCGKTLSDLANRIENLFGVRARRGAFSV